MIWGILFFLALLAEGVMMTMESWWGLLFIAFTVWFCWYLNRPIYVDDLP